MTSTKPNPISTYYPFDKGGYFLPEEEMCMVEKKQKRLVIGIPKEDHKYECRIPLTPQSVALLAKHNHQIIIESGAGKGANYSDLEYTEAGAYISHDREEIFKAEIVLKIAPPTLYEVELMHGKQTLISSFHSAIQNEEGVRALLQKRITALAFEYIKDEYDSPPIVRSMSEIAGTSSILIASEYLSNVNGGKGILLGGITGVRPTKVVIVGAGTAGEYAARTAMGLGALVSMFDSSLYKLRKLQNNLGQRIFTSVLHPQVLKQTLKTADVLIGALNFLNKTPRFAVTDDMVRTMKSNSVIVDIGIDQGGCIETSEPTTHEKPTFKKYDVIHYCVPNIPSRVARTASISLSNVFIPILMDLSNTGGIEQLLVENIGLRNGVYLFNGILTNSSIGKMLGIPSRDINLLMATL